MIAAEDAEWQSEPHTLVVYSVEPPMDKWDEWHLEYDIEHPPACGPMELWRYGSEDYLDRAKTCFVDYCISGDGIEHLLSYSHTPISKPGTYLIVAWGTKRYYWDMGYEYDASIRVIAEGSARTLLTRSLRSRCS